MTIEIFYRKRYLDFNRRTEFSRIHIDIVSENGEKVGISRADVCLTFDEIINIAFEEQKGGIVSRNPNINRFCQYLAITLAQDPHKCEVIIQHLISNDLLIINNQGLLFIPNWSKWIVDNIGNHQENFLEKIKRKREGDRLRQEKKRSLKKLKNNDVTPVTQGVTPVTQGVTRDIAHNVTPQSRIGHANDGVTGGENISDFQSVNDVTPYLLLNTYNLEEEKARTQKKKESESEIKIVFDKLKKDFSKSFPVNYRKGDHAATERLLYDIVVDDIELAKNLSTIASKWVSEASKMGYLTTPENWLREKKWLDGILDYDKNHNINDKIKRIIWHVEMKIGTMCDKSIQELKNFMKEHPSTYRKLRVEVLKKYVSANSNRFKTLNDEQKRFLLENTKS